MNDFSEMLSLWFSNLDVGRLLCLGVFIAILSTIRDVTRKALKAVLTIIAILAVLYFFVPDIYITAIEGLKTGLDNLGNVFESASGR